MTEVNNKAVRDLMLNLYPSKDTVKVSGHQINASTDNHRDSDIPNEHGESPKHRTRLTQIGTYNDTFVHPYLKKQQKEMSVNLKKWVFALMISIFSVFLFSGFFLSFIDDVCMKKEVYLFDSNGSPKPTLLIILFVILISFSRILFEFI
jgi:hypothetical protein